MSEHLSNYNGRTPPNRRHSPQTRVSSNSYSNINEYDNDYNSKYQHLRKWYETRVRELSEDIKKAFEIVQSDVLIDTMKQDPTSGEYVNQRVKEIIEDCLANDRELLLEKMAHHCSNLKADYAKLEQESIEYHNQQEQVISDLNSRIERLQSQCKDEVMKRESFENEAQKLRLSLHNVTKKYEESSHVLEDQVKRIEGHDTIERLELENKIREYEERNREILQKHAQLQKELNSLKVRAKEQEMEASSLSTELDLAQNKLKEANKKVREFDREEHELKMRLEEFQEENAKLVQALGRVDVEIKDDEAKFRRRIEDMEREKEREMEKMSKMYREKIEVYKKKLMSYKERLSGKEKEIQTVQKRNEVEMEKLQKNIQELEGRIQEEKSKHSRAVRAMEEESYYRLSEAKKQHDEELRVVQDQLKGLLNQKVSQLQEDADEQIHYLRKQEKELQGLLEEKIVELERDYVKREYHEKLVEEKNSLVRDLREEMKKKEVDYQNEMNGKVKSAEERLGEEYNGKIKSLKGVIMENEQQVRELSENLKVMEQKVKLMTEERKAMLGGIEELEIQKRRLNESVEDWELKCKKLKVMYDEEQMRRSEYERELRIYQEKFKEVNDKLEAYSKETNEKENQLKYLSYEASNLQATLKEGSKERKRLDRELEESNRVMLESRDALKSLQEENRLVKEENKRLNDKIKETIFMETQKYDKEFSEHMKAKNKLKSVEEKVAGLNVKIGEDEYLIQQLRRNLDEQESQNRQLTAKLEESREKIEDLSRLKNQSEKKNERMLARFLVFRRNTFSELEKLKTDLGDMKNFSRSFASSVVRQYELKLFELQNQIKLLIEKKEKAHLSNIESIKERLHSESSQALDKLRQKHLETCSDLQEEYEKKYLDYKRQVQNKDEEKSILETKIEEIEKDVGKRESRETQLEREFFELKREKEALGIKLEQAKQIYIKQIEEAQEEMDKRTEAFMEEKKAMEEAYMEELDLMRREIENLQDNHNVIIKKYEEQVRDLAREQEIEVKGTKKELQEEVNQLEESVESGHEAEDVLMEKVARLENKIARMKERSVELEKENQSLRDMHEMKLEAYEQKLVEVSKLVETENQAAMLFKEEKLRETGQYLRTIHALEEELIDKEDRISKLVGERRKLEQSIKELQGDLGVKIEVISNEKQDLLKKTLQQTKEIEQLHSLLSKSYKARPEQFDETRKRVGKEGEGVRPGDMSYRVRKERNYTEEDLDMFRMQSASHRGYDTKEKMKARSIYYDPAERNEGEKEREGNNPKKRH